MPNPVLTLILILPGGGVVKGHFILKTINPLLAVFKKKKKIFKLLDIMLKCLSYNLASKKMKNCLIYGPLSPPGTYDWF